MSIIALVTIDLHRLRSSRVGLALSGGSVRGLAHIGVIKALHELGVFPQVIAGTSAGSLIGAGLAAGFDWRSLAEMARSIFWPTLLHGEQLERFCLRFLPSTFCRLKHPFAAVATLMPAKQAYTIKEGRLACAISASCAMRFVRKTVVRQGKRLKDGGMACVLPTEVCRDLGAEVVVASDVWEFSSVMRSMGCRPECPTKGQAYPMHFRRSIAQADLLIQPDIPLTGYLPTSGAVQRMTMAGESATREQLQAAW